MTYPLYMLFTEISGTMTTWVQQRTILFIGLLLFGGWLQTADAIEKVWTGAGNGTSFDSSLNWDFGVPGVIDIATFNNDGGNIIFATAPTTDGLEVKNTTVSFDIGTLMFSLTGDMIIGDNLNEIGQLTITNGTLHATDTLLIEDVFIGRNAGSIGEITIDGPTAGFDASITVLVGDVGTGSLNVINGGAFTSTATFIADNLGSLGELQVIGAGSTWTNSGQVFVGNNGTGSLMIFAGGVATCNGLVRIGDNLGGQGSVVIDGVGSLWTCQSEVAVGNFDTGRIDVLNGATLNTTRGKIGDEPGSNGTIIINGPGSTWNDTVEIFVGNFGTGTLNVTGGASINSAAAFIGDDPGSNGQVTIDGLGSTWTNSLAMIIGHLGTGSMTVSNGATASALSITTGVGFGSSGSVVLSGSGSSLTTFGDLKLGLFGSSHLTIESGGSATVLGAYSQNNAATLHVEIGPGFVPAMNVTGTAQLSGNLDIIIAGAFVPASAQEFELINAGSVLGTFMNVTVPDGYTLVMEGARVLLRADVIISPYDLNSDGSVTVEDLCLWNANPIDVNDDGVVDSADAQAIAAVIVDPFIDLNNNIIPDLCETGGYIGKPGGSWFITTNWFGGQVPLAGQQVLISTPVSISAPGATAGDVIIGNGGCLTITAAGIGLSANTITVLNGGCLIDNGSTVAATMVTVHAGGMLSGTGTVQASVMNFGDVAPGNSIGSLVITGDYTQTASGTLQIELDASGTGADLLNIQGNAFVDGILELFTIGVGVPQVGAIATVITATAIDGVFGGLAWSAFSTDGYYEIINGLNSVKIEVMPAQTRRISMTQSGEEGDNQSVYAVLSGDGRYAAFHSNAANLTTGDLNGVQDVFVVDRQTGQIDRVSVSSTGIEGNDFSNRPSLSFDGRYVVFKSLATNLVPGDTNGVFDTFVHDRQTGQTSRISVGPGGAQGSLASGTNRLGISSNGRFVGFESTAPELVAGGTNGQQHVFVRDRDPDGNGIFNEGNGTTILISRNSAGELGNDTSNFGAISGDGRFVVFHGWSTNLVPGDTNNTLDVFVRDRDPDENGIFDEANGMTIRVSVNSTGTQAALWSNRPAISGDGRFVTFQSPSPDLVSGDTNGVIDVFLRDRDSDGNGIFDEPGDTTTRISVDSIGAQSDADSGQPTVSLNGQFIAFRSSAANLVVGDTNGVLDVFVHEIATGLTTRASVTWFGGQANNTSGGAAELSLSADGRLVGFDSDATNMTPFDSNGQRDSFVHDRQPDVITLPSDLNGDGMVEVMDLLILLGNWGCVGCEGDIVNDGVVNILDLLQLLADWGLTI